MKETVINATAKSWTLVTVTYNSAADLRSFWKEPPLDAADWIVVDNSSADDSASIARQLGATVLCSKSNLGFSGGNNYATASVKTRFVAFVNPDVTVHADALATLGDHLDKHGGLVAPQLVDPDGGLQPNGRGWPTIWAKLLHRIAPRWGGYRRWPARGGCIECVWLMGAFVAAETATFRDIGGWNDAYFVYYEDAELGIRANQLGLRVNVCDEARATHGWARDTGRLNRAAWRNEFFSAFKFYRQHPRLLLPLRQQT